MHLMSILIVEIAVCSAILHLAWPFVKIFSGELSGEPRNVVIGDMCKGKNFVIGTGYRVCLCLVSTGKKQNKRNKRNNAAMLGCC